jgi:hypothetical protein
MNLVRQSRLRIRRRRIRLRPRPVTRGGCFINLAVVHPTGTICPRTRRRKPRKAAEFGVWSASPLGTPIKAIKQGAGGNAFPTISQLSVFGGCPTCVAQHGVLPEGVRWLSQDAWYRPRASGHGATICRRTFCCLVGAPFLASRPYGGAGVDQRRDDRWSSDLISRVKIRGSSENLIMRRFDRALYIDSPVYCLII